MLKELLKKVAKRVFPSMSDGKSGGACHEAAFDPDQFPDTMKKALKARTENGSKCQGNASKDDSAHKL